ncbi:MAG: bifunctional phosphopantothenoylcysteine decarboxylase/phosphopantothenate--cysteine ligase CoaBC [Candidatus Thorarchaeota archaeon]
MRQVSSITHTSKLIIGSLSQSLSNRRIALCVTGSVAAVECVALSRLLMRHGSEVYSVMSPMAHMIIHPNLLEWATGNPVVVELTGQIEHITLAGKHDEHVDLVLVAPATANTIGKIANGIDDTPVTTTVSSAIGAKIPVLVVPAMHESMYDHPAVIQNIEKLQEIGIHVMNPRMEEAKAKIPDPEEIVSRVISLLGPQDLNGKHFVITAGPTRGWIDRVRFITNPSSGRMGIEVAKEVISRGGTVDLILGPVSHEPPREANVQNVETPDEMFSSVMETLTKSKTDVFISIAAVLDYLPLEMLDTKIPSGTPELTIILKPTEKIIDAVRKKHKKLFVVGFKVESGVTDKELEKRAMSKVDSGVCDLVVANDASREGVAFDTITNQVLIVGRKGVVKQVPLSMKRDVAREIVNTIVEVLS